MFFGLECTLCTGEHIVNLAVVGTLMVKNTDSALRMNSVIGFLQKNTKAILLIHIT